MGQRFGKYAASGAVETEATVCVLTGRPVSPDNSVREGVSRTAYFYRVVGGQYDRVTDEDRARWHAEAIAQDAPAPVVAEVKERRPLVKTTEGQE
jgi:hypothetical protein